ncbi:hypothetical protein COX75_00470 [bacterium (Candidatus Gribaldobacteria) CG_4_10_14_0_2_um_filter_33_15]|nr:MAG: hypothetical protein COU04_00355 [bacterium (Candidatus Gribaldobacteria) CG10_big_fil_rev_8_21_14_0_10_33_41]PJA01200.1 MAG: hypothetical protein COX75_00470 [bacterium (Candidatus Gribaldobacteria) CG_4_10_14_0_2_um_filter_33_15]
MKRLILPIFSAGLGCLTFLFWSNPLILIFVLLIHLVPLFIFFLKEQKLLNLILGTFLFKYTFLIISVSPLLLKNNIYLFLFVAFFLSFFVILPFLGFPLSLYFLKKKCRNSHILLLILPFLWTFWEIIGTFFNIEPSILLLNSGALLAPTKFLGLAKFGGFFSLTLFVAIVNTLVVGFFLNLKNKKVAIFYSITIGLVIISSFYLSQINLERNAIEYQNRKESLKIASISVTRDFDSEFLKVILEKENLTEEKFNEELTKTLRPIIDDLKKEQIDLIAFPEYFPGGLTTIREKQKIEPDKFLFNFYQKLSGELNTDILTSFEKVQDGEKYNSIIHFKKDGKFEIYNKRHPSLLGEIMPSFVRRNYPLKTIKKGEDFVLFKIKNFSFFPVPCSEQYYPLDLIKAKTLRAKFLSNLTSNRWVDKKLLERGSFIHNNLRKINAVWLKMPIVISGWDDIAGIIRTDGQIEKVETVNEKDYKIFFGEIKL